MDEIFKHEDLLPETKTSLNTRTSKIPTGKRNPANCITIINNHYYVDSDSSSVEGFDEDSVYYKDEYFDYGEMIKPDLDIEAPIGLIYSFRKKGKAVISDDTSVCRSSSTDSSRNFVRHPDQGCKIVELNSPTERLPTPIPGLYNFNQNTVYEGVLPIVTEVSDNISTDDNAARTIILENTWFIGYENEPFKNTSYSIQPKYEVDIQNKDTSQVTTKTQECEYDMKNRVGEVSVLSPQICDTDINIKKRSFRDKLIARAKAKREMLETGLSSPYQFKDKIKSHDKAQNRSFDRVLTKDVYETDFNWDNVKQNNIQISMATRKIGHNSAPNDKSFRRDNIPHGLSKSSCETQAIYEQNSPQDKDTLMRVENHRQSTNDNFTPDAKSKHILNRKK
ncbi:hypothetical protein EVAR_22163_1 [Eumeta japonica]|uniref:Uncharacterized protein n=1 Tax=Eumeta variegata TaxID=151549 RepID=A0A4C1W1A6_EUMVA|nr:hypothetical protein EVAR_22163_1 [Eumeta japonica]